MRKNIVQALAAVAVSVAALSACSAPGVAGSVNGTNISEKQVDSLAAEIRDNGGKVSTRLEIFNLVVANTLLEETLEQYGGFNPDQKNVLLKQCAANLRFLGPAKKVPEGLESYCLTLSGAQYDPKLAQAANKALSTANVTISKRYGVVSKGKLALPAYLQAPTSK